MQITEIMLCLFKKFESLVDSCFFFFYTMKAEFLCTAVTLRRLKNCFAESHDYQCTCCLHCSV